MLLGVAEGLASAFLGGAYREIVALGAFLLVLLLRPQGLFGARMPSREGHACGGRA